MVSSCVDIKQPSLSVTCLNDAQALTVFVKREFVEPESAGLFAHKVVSELAAQVVDGDGVLQRLHTRLQTEGDLGVTHRVSVDKEAGTHKNMGVSGTITHRILCTIFFAGLQIFSIIIICLPQITKY